MNDYYTTWINSNMRTLCILMLSFLYFSSALSDNRIIPDTNNIYTQQKTVPVNDSTEFKADTSFMEHSFTSILFQLQSLASEQEFIIKSYRKLVIILLIIMSFLIIVIIINIRKRIYFPRFPFYRQKKGYQSGLVCLQMISKYYGKKISYKKIRKVSEIPGALKILSVNDIKKTAEKIGFNIKVIRADINRLISDLLLPLILYLPNHMAILYKITNEFVYIADPFYGFLKLKIYYFLSTWYAAGKNQSGIALLIRPSANFKGRTGRIIKAQTVDYSEIKQLEKAYLDNIKVEI